MSKAAEQEVKSTAVGANLIEEEKMEIGGVKWEVYSYYAKSIGFLFTSGTFLLYAVYQGFSLGKAFKNCCKVRSKECYLYLFSSILLESQNLLMR